MRRYDYNAQGQLLDAYRVPLFQPSPVVERVIVPGLQAAMIATASGVFFGCGCWLTDLAPYAVPVGVLAGSLSFAVCMAEAVGLAADLWQAAPAPEEPEPLPTETPAVVLVNAKSAAAVTPTAQRRAELPDRFRAFVEDAAIDSGRERLEALKYTRPEIDHFRELLMRAGFARFRTANPRNGWILTEEPAVILSGDRPAPE